MDSLSYTSTSRIRALVCPVGKIKRSRFQSFLNRLRRQAVVRLGDVSPLPRSDRTTFSPQGFPDGEIVYEFKTTTNREHEYLEPYQLYRRCFIIIGIADYTEGVPSETLIQQLEDLKQRHRKPLHAVTLLFDTPRDASLSEDLASYNPDGNGKVFMPVPPKDQERITDMRTVMCDITASLLSEFSGFAKTLMSYSSVDSPMAALANGQTEAPQSHRLSLPTSGFNALSGNNPSSTVDKRMSIQGFGSGSLTERARNKGRARIQINIAELFLLAGRLPDALREFLEGASTARSNNDHLWHAKALEGIGVCLLLLARLKIDFQMPQIPYPSIEAAAKSKSDKAKAGDDSTIKDPHDLLEILPELFNTTLNLYSRAANFQGEAAPYVCYAESILRMSRLLVAAYLNNGLDSSTLDHIVVGMPLPTQKSTVKPGAKLPSRMDIATCVMKAYPGPMEKLSVLESTRTYAGIASVLGCIGFRRRKALVTRELIRCLIPGLIQARIAGAAEAGVHPAAGLSAMALPNAGGVDLMEQESEVGIVELLEDLCSSFGIMPMRPSESSTEASAKEPAATDIVMAENDVRSFGWTSLKIQILKSCIHLCEALPDLRGAMQFTTQLLKTAGVDLPKEEQMRLSNNIGRTMGAARKLGLSDVEGEYWDAFLLRDIEVAESSIYKTPVPHTEEELGISSTSRPESNPFIYNPFMQGDKKPAEIFVVQEESVEFKITLQNPFEFEVEVESLLLDADGVTLEAEPISAIIPAFRTCEVSAFASPKAAGKLQITGCKIKVFGCKERAFPIFTEGFGQSQLQSKAKAIGLSAVEQKVKRPLSQDAGKRQSKRASTIPDKPLPKVVNLTVVPPQPLVFAKSTSLSQSAIMVLEGEKKIFSIKLHNASTVPVDLILFSFEDSTTAQLKAALSTKDISPSDIYEYETFLLKRRAFSWHRTDEEKKKDGSVVIEPNATASFQVQVLGKPGLTTGTVQVDYGYKQSRSENRYFTRQVVLPLTVTVNASVELVRVDFLPLSSSIPPDHGGAFSSLFKKISRGGDPSEYCLMLLDLRNAWPRPLKVKLTVNEDDEQDEEPFSTDSLLAPGHTNRLLLPLRRIYLKNPHAAIPSISAKQRQFVVSTTKISAEQERLQREAFWYREKVLSAVRAEWEEIDTGKKGDVELRTIRLGGRGIETLRVDNVRVSVDVVGEKVTRVHKGCYRISTNEFHKLRITVTNRTEASPCLLLRVLPTLKNQTLNEAMDLNRRLLFNGVLQRGVGVLAPGEEKVVEVSFVGLVVGEYQVSAIVEEFKAPGEWIEGGRIGGKVSVDVECSDKI